MKICIIDYGMGNIRSVQKAFARVGCQTEIIQNSDDIFRYKKIVLPGVGNFHKGINTLKSTGFFETLNEAVLEKKIPILGICLGMQLMTSNSEEGDCEGLGWIKAKTTKFNFKDNSLKIPHMGWNNLLIQQNNPLLDKIKGSDFFYFVHSYNIECYNKENVIAYTQYGKTFVSIFRKDNIYGCQFHPEKSYDSGLKLLKNFVEL